MLKKLVALTLAALMLINPMTAFAVSWGEVKTALEMRNTVHSFDDDSITAIADDEGNVIIEGFGGSIENFKHSDEFKSYTFKGEIHFNGEIFEVYVSGDQKAVVNIESGVAITATEVRFGVDDNATLTVTTKGNIGFEADGTLVTERVSFDVNEEATANAKMEVVNEGDIAANENIWMSADGEGELVVTNNGTMTAENEIGMHAYGSAEGTLTNNGTLTANASGLGEEGAQVGIGVHGEGSATLVNGESGVINSELSGWLDSDSTGGSVSITNQGTVTGNVGAWGFEGYEDEDGNWVSTSGSIELDNQGTVGGNLGTYTRDDTSTKITNSGTVEGEMFADNMGSQDMTMTNSGDVNSLFVNNNGGANATVTNSGNVLGGEVRVEAGSGSLSFSNTGTIEGERFDAHAYGEGTVTGSNTGTIDVEWGYVGSSDNGNSSFTNESDGYIHTDENFDIAAGNWSGDENYPGLNAENSSSTSFVNSGEVVTEGSFAGNLFENGSVTLENTETGTMTAVNQGIHIGNSGNGEGSVSVNNAGTVNSEWFNVGSEKGGDASISNSGTVNGSMGAFADGVYDDQGNVIAENNGGSVSVNNSGTVNGNIDSYVNGTGSTTVTNSGTAENVYANGTGEGSVTVSNSGTVSSEMWVSVDGEATGSVTNDGDVAYGGVGAYEDGSMTFENNGSYGDVFVDSMQNADMTATNNGEIGYVYTGVDNNATSSFTNNNTVGELWAESYGEGAMNATNNGTVDYKMGGGAYGEGQTTITNSGTIGDGEQNYDEEGNELAPDGVWGFAAEGGVVTVTNNGTVNGEVGGGAGEGSTATVNNNGTANSAWIDAHGGDVALNNAGTVSGTLSVSIGTQSNAVTDVETVAALLEQTGVNISGYETVEIYTANQNGELIARYSVAEDGTVVLEEVIMQEKQDGPDVKSEEQIRHEMEEKRKAAEIGGVYGSPYWLKQLYLGYMSLNLRLFDGEEQLVFKESVSWVPGTGKLGEKVLTLNVQIEDTANLTMRLDGAVIDKLEQAGIVTINIVDGTGNLFMQYQVEDLKGARAMYGLTEKEYIVVGSADADVMKIAEDGTISPIEGETGAAEEVADEANKETDGDTVEETPAA